MDFQRFREYEVDGRNLRSITDVFRLFPAIGLQPFVKRGFASADAKGKISMDQRSYYPFAAWLEIQHEIVERVGTAKAFEIGRAVPRGAVFPPGVHDIESGLRSIDVAYYMNHRRVGQGSLGPTALRPGEIGHYRVDFDGRARRAVMECDTPYPCDFDRGIVFTIATRFEPTARVEYLEPMRSRRSGSPSSVYEVSW